MEKKITFLFGLAVGILILVTTSCNKMDVVPTDKFTDANFWQSTDNAELIVNMAYNQMYSADKMWNDEALSDNVFEGRSNTDQRAIRNGIATPTLGRFESEWKQAYEGIKTCHIFLKNINLVSSANESWKKQKIAEIRFIRAYIYFRLVNFYGSVPFFTSDITLEESGTIARTPKATVLGFIHEELSAISADLPTRSQLDESSQGRITRGAALAFQARAYLYESNWQKTADYCDSLINHQDLYGAYKLFGDYAGLFVAANEYNDEVILDCGYVPIVRTWSKLYDAAPRSAGARLNAFAPVQSLVDNYLMLNGNTISEDSGYSEDNPYVNRDPRLAATVVFHGGTWQDFNSTVRTINIKPGSNGDNADIYAGASANASPTGYYIKKYYDITATSTFDAGLNIIMFRYADILLMYAEAKQQLGQFDAAVWDRTIRAVRERAGFKTTKALDFPSGLSETAMTALIRNERRSEMALEGLRYFDIVRWKAGKTYLDGVVNGAKFANGNNSYIVLDQRRFDETRDYLWSVPQSQSEINKSLLPNNPGYAN